MVLTILLVYSIFFFQAEDGIRVLVRSRGLGDVYKRQGLVQLHVKKSYFGEACLALLTSGAKAPPEEQARRCLLYTSDAADERSSVDLGGRRIIKQKNTIGLGSGRK